MEDQLRPLSPRPSVTVDQAGALLVDPVPGPVGVPGPFGRGRLLHALRTNKGGVGQVLPAVVVRDEGGCLLVDADGNVLGTAGVWVHRLLRAMRTYDTRRL